MKKEDWIWMPHAGHFILGTKCEFRLNTYVGGYIVSTVGELWCDRRVREIHAEVHDPEWFKQNKHLKGDYFDAAYFKKFGFEEVGCGRTYETMVFKAKESDHKCCSFVMKDTSNVDSMGYNTDEDAVKGHMKMCEKWSKKAK